MKTLAYIGAMLTLGGCIGFPPHGTGGFAEHQRYTHATAYPGAFLRIWDGKQLRFSQRNITKVDCIDYRLAELRQHGVNEYYPAQLWLIEQQRNRTLRLFASGMGWDGERELQTLQDMVEDLHQRTIFQDHIKIDLARHPEKTQCTASL